MSSKTLFASILSGLMAIAIQPMSAATPSLAGSWQFTLTATTPPSSTTPATETPGLATFTADGSVIETDGSEFAPSVPSSTAEVIKATPGHGIWQLANTPETLFVKYISLLLDADGALYGQNMTTMFLTIDATTGTTFKGAYTTLQIIGTLTRIVSTGTVSGVLIPHVPLP
jgi:hypothetical protein